MQLSRGFLAALACGRIIASAGDQQVLGLGASRPEFDSANSEDKWLTEEFDRLVEKSLEKFHVPGISVAVIDGEETFTKAYGIANGPEPVTPETLFYTGSTTKAFTAAALSLLVDDNENFPHVQWRTPVSSLIREDFVLSDPRWTDIITLEDILSHRTGQGQHDISYGPNSTVRSIVRSMRHLKLALEPRTEFLYCNIMFVTASHVIETLTGQHLGDFLAERIWKPLGMNSTYFSLQDAQSSGLPMARGYDWLEDKQEYVPVDYMDFPHVSGAGTMISNVLDYSKWIRMWLTKAGPLSSYGHEQLLTPRTLQPITKKFGPAMLFSSYSLGWDIQVYRGVTIVQHDGGLFGFGTKAMFLPEYNWGFTSMGNTMQTSNMVFRALAFQLVDNLLGVPEKERFDHVAYQWKYLTDQLTANNATLVRNIVYPPDSTPYFPPTLPLSSFAGTYHDPGYGNYTFVFSESTQTLVANIERTWIDKLELEHVTGSFFFGTASTRSQHLNNYMESVFEVDAKGMATKFGFHYRGMDGADTDMDGWVWMTRV